MEKKVGTLEPGKMDDVIVIAGDPLRDINVLCEKGNVVSVYKDGLDVRAKLSDQMGLKA